MSVIIYSDGIMAADTRAYSGGTHPIGSKMKIHRLNDGSLLGITSNIVGTPEVILEWFNTGKSDDFLVPEDPSFEALHVTLDGKVFLYNDSYTPSGPLAGKNFTIGSGRKYALGALAAGKDVYEAVEIACGCDLFCGLPVAAIELHEASPEAPVSESEPADA